jgi:hypothetical protein
MKIRKLPGKQMDFLSDAAANGAQLIKITATTHQKIAHLISQLLLSIICQNQAAINEDRHANKN